MSSHSVVALPGWNLESLSLCRTPESSALLSVTHIASESCSPECATALSAPLPSLTMLPDSTGDPGLDAYIASLPVSPVSLGVWLGSGKGSRTSDGYGQTSIVLCVRSSRSGSSWKKFLDLFEEDWDWSSETLPTSGFGTPTTFSARPTWGRRTSASGCSSWPTPNIGTGRGLPVRGDLQVAAVEQFWGTPTTRDWKDGACAEQNVPTNGLLGRQVCREGMWATPNAADCTGTHGGGQGRSLRTDISSHLDLPTTTDGESSSNSTRRLNPLFVEMLQGFPIGFSDCGP